MARRGVKGDGRDYYEILGVSPSASPEQLKAAYRNLVRKYHPDLYRTYVQKLQATRKLQEINAAYAVLSSAEHRRAYDQQRGETPTTYTPSASQRSETMGQASKPPQPPKEWWVRPLEILWVVIGVVIWVLAYRKIYAAESPQSLPHFLLAVFISFGLAFIGSAFLIGPWVMFVVGMEKRWKSTEAKPAHVIKDFAVRFLGLGLLLLGTLPVLLGILPDLQIHSLIVCFIALILGPMLLGELVASVAYVIWARKVVTETHAWW